MSKTHYNEGSLVELEDRLTSTMNVHSVVYIDQSVVTWFSTCQPKKGEERQCLGRSGDSTDPVATSAPRHT
jgi:hypothetical protein